MKKIRLDNYVQKNYYRIYTRLLEFICVYVTGSGILFCWKARTIMLLKTVIPLYAFMLSEVLRFLTMSKWNSRLPGRQTEKYPLKSAQVPALPRGILWNILM